MKKFQCKFNSNYSQKFLTNFFIMVFNMTRISCFEIANILAGNYMKNMFEPDNNGRK